MSRDCVSGVDVACCAASRPLPMPMSPPPDTVRPRRTRPTTRRPGGAPAHAAPAMSPSGAPGPSHGTAASRRRGGGGHRRARGRRPLPRLRQAQQLRRARTRHPIAGETRTDDGRPPGPPPPCKAGRAKRKSPPFGTRLRPGPGRATMMNGSSTGGLRATGRPTWIRPAPSGTRRHPQPVAFEVRQDHEGNGEPRKPSARSPGSSVSMALICARIGTRAGESGLTRARLLASCAWLVRAGGRSARSRRGRVWPAWRGLPARP